MITIVSGGYEAKISMDGAELKSFKRLIDGKEFLWCADPGVWGKTSPVLFPFAGLLKDKSFTYKGKTYFQERHGFARNCKFKGELLTPSKAEFTLNADSETLKNYPFNFTLKKTVSLNCQTLSIEFTVINNDDKTMYYGIGGHTAFATEGGNGLDECTLKFKNCGEYYCTNLNNDGLTIPQKRLLFKGDELKLSSSLFNNDSLAFDKIISDEVCLVRPGCETIKFSSSNLPALVLWATTGTKRFICIEPWTSVPERVDADKNIENKTNLIALEKGAQNKHGFVIEIVK